MHFLELVPRELESFEALAKEMTGRYPAITAVNVPDVLRLPHRSYDAVGRLLKSGIRSMPHLRSIDNTVEQTVDIVRRLVDLGLKEVLIVSGDLPSSPQVQTFPVTPVMVVEALKKQFDDLTVYCGIDPYRASFVSELAYCRQKLDAGADGFFSQPFFDPKLAQIYLDQLSDTIVFLGISPVVTEKSMNYWKTVNKAIFPSQFSLEFDYNCRLASDLIEVADQVGQHVYLMPIRLSVSDYLSGIYS